MSFVWSFEDRGVGELEMDIPGPSNCISDFLSRHPASAATTKVVSETNSPD